MANPTISNWDISSANVEPPRDNGEPGKTLGVGEGVGRGVGEGVGVGSCVGVGVGPKLMFDGGGGEYVCMGKGVEVGLGIGVGMGVGVGAGT